ncbi:glycerol-3-phosphate dehydrogenase [Rhizobium sp. ACO-34A]|nr:NAD/NADP-dependent octopine/nopaline dehydrogenase family protein [Rhizobium sp. ACO-34A]ATN32303.1 glycerol-3-phosphate dehydrogenase [Rhizobium sp. ACO-34A]
MLITVLGGGNGSLAAAADFALAGHTVTLWRRGEADVSRHRELGNRLVVRDAGGKHEALLHQVTSDLAEAIGTAELIFCAVPAPAHGDIAARVAPYLRPGQVVHLPPGTFGTLVFARAAEAAGTVEGVAFAESGTLPWLVRKHGFAEMVVSARATRLPTGIFPLKLESQALALLDKAFPCVIEACGDALSGALMNAGPIIHPPLIIMNAAPLEHFPAWDIHNEGTQPSIRRVTDALDAERIAVREALGYGAPHFPLADHYNHDGDEWMYGRGSHSDLTDSGDWREKIVLTEHRYMLEDVCCGLSLMVSAARLAGVAVPVAEGLMTIGGTICGQDFMKTGRALPAVGLADMDRATLQSVLDKGFGA